MYRVQSFKIEQRDTKQLHRYLERQVSDEGEEGDGSVDVPPGSGHTGSAQHLPVPEPNTELQSHVRRRLPRCSTTTSQGDVEPDGGTRTIHTSEFGIKTTEYKYCDTSGGREEVLPVRTRVHNTDNHNLLPRLHPTCYGTSERNRLHTHTHTHLHEDAHIVMNYPGSNWRRTDKIKACFLITRTWRLDVTRVLSASLSAERTLALFPSVKDFCGKTHF